jgi:hypothetical protein
VDAIQDAAEVVEQEVESMSCTAVEPHVVFTVHMDGYQPAAQVGKAGPRSS